MADRCQPSDPGRVAVCHARHPSVEDLIRKQGLAPGRQGRIELDAALAPSHMAEALTRIDQIYAFPIVVDENISELRQRIGEIKEFS